MASACVNNVAIPSENFLDCSVSYGWLNPRISFGRENNNHDDHTSSSSSSKGGGTAAANALPPLKRLDPDEVSDLQVTDKDLYDFEFRLEDPVIMLPADELFSDGKLVPLLFPVSRPVVEPSSRVPSTRRSLVKEPVEIDPFLFSPKAPRCSSRWKELLGLKKLSLNGNSKVDVNNSSSQSTGINNGSKSRRLFLNRSSKPSSSSIESSLNIPLLKDLDSHSVTKSSRRSLSLCSSSCQDHDDLPRLSLDSDKHILKQSYYNRISNAGSSNPPPRMRLLKQRPIPSENQASARVGRSPVRITPESSVTLRGVSMDSPRMNSSGKVIFQGLERSSSSPSTFNGGPPNNNNKQRGMERSYSANVRVTPFLNVPVGSLSKSSVFGFQLFPTTPQKRDGGGGGGSYSSSTGGASRGQQQHQVSGRIRF
ncbi:uncharacterized protein LOC124940288 [Impatiens glandulifera]|uniref:uncharacterized protein LOC124940288 n=1 Tax=Impatiens glandulifera TaxID=253017 RepID=UPI001FB0A1EF|nr:uncharacterized protein LOC124940288 [Impatiens glandulifera]